MKRALVLLTLSLTCLTACAAGPSSRPDLVSLCPEPVAYGRGFQMQLADELERIPNSTAIWRAMLDYGQLRDVLRAC